MPPAATDEQLILIDDEATRLGSRALFYSALLSLVVSVVLPSFVAEAAGDPPQNQTSSWWQRVCRVPRRLQVHLVTMWAASHLVFASCMFATLCVTSSLQLPCMIYCLLDASFTVSLTAYGGPLLSSLSRAFRGLLLNGLHSPWLVIITLWLILRLPTPLFCSSEKLF